MDYIFVAILIGGIGFLIYKARKASRSSDSIENGSGVLSENIENVSEVPSESNTRVNEIQCAKCNKYRPGRQAKLYYGTFIDDLQDRVKTKKSYNKIYSSYHIDGHLYVDICDKCVKLKRSEDMIWIVLAIGLIVIESIIIVTARFFRAFDNDFMTFIVAMGAIGIIYTLIRGIGNIICLVVDSKEVTRGQLAWQLKTAQAHDENMRYFTEERYKRLKPKY